MGYQFTIYINGVRFTADCESINDVESALKEWGFLLDDYLGGWFSPGFYHGEEE